MNRRILLITGVSCSWKTTLQKYMLEQGWQKPINFSTRQARNDEELDEYVFLTEDQYFTKLKNWDFLEHTNYWWNWYWISKHLPEGNVCIILDPIWRAMASEYFIRNNISFETIFLDCDLELQQTRLLKRWDNEEEIKKRTKDFSWFYPTNKCKVLEWRIDTNLLYKLI